MPTLQSLSIRRRGTTPVKSSSAPPATTTSTIKGLFHRKTIDSTTRKSSLDKSNDKMGNAPSDMNGNATNGTPRQKAASASASDGDSVRSRAMPGAEPPTPTPAPEPVVEKTEEQRSPEPGTVQVQGYDTLEVPHVLHDSPKPNMQSDLEIGFIPPVGSFEDDEPQSHVQAQEARNLTGSTEPADAARTPRAELKTQEGLAPLDLGSLPPHHPIEGSDVTAVAVSPRAGTPPIWTPGTYVLLNARSGTAMDLSGADNKTVIGYPMHGGPNQQWEFIPTGHGYIIRCVRRSKEGHALYLTTEGGVNDGMAIVANTYPVAWNIEQTEDGIRISWPNSEYAFDLAEWGNSAPGTKIQLATRKSSEACQHWHYTRCAPASEPEREGETDKVLEAHSARAVSPPATTETITVSEERDFVTTTRTTTTTVITTVTEVTRTPKSLFRQVAQPQRRSIAYR